MRQTTDGRELILLDIFDTIVHGTYHRPRSTTSEAQQNLSTRHRMGVLLLNGLYVTRAANGDAAVYWADSFANSGYPSFRVDLPGFGDSESDPPEDLLGFVNSGGYAPAIAAIIKHLVQSFALSGIVLVGHCSGAVSALYAASAAPTECKGLVLMDPYFHLPHKSTTGVRHQLNIWAIRGRIGRLLSRAFDFVKQFQLVVRSGALPANANVPVIRACKELASSGVPILILKAPSRRAIGTNVRMGEFDYLNCIIKGCGSQHHIAVISVEGANHSFSSHQDRVVVRDNIVPWLTAHFPCCQREEDPELTSSRLSDVQGVLDIENVASV